VWVCGRVCGGGGGWRALSSELPSSLLTPRSHFSLRRRRNGGGQARVPGVRCCGRTEPQEGGGAATQHPSPSPSPTNGRRQQRQRPQNLTSASGDAIWGAHGLSVPCNG
jgi:hypothetical protein